VTQPRFGAVRLKLLALPFFILLLSCQSTGGWKMPDTDDGSHANSAAYAADSMMFRKDMPHRDPSSDWEFYYKHCSMNGQRDIYTRDMYDCSGPAF
jgi:hypothetical protein